MVGLAKARPNKKMLKQLHTLFHRWTIIALATNKPAERATRFSAIKIPYRMHSSLDATSRIYKIM